MFAMPDEGAARPPSAILKQTIMKFPVAHTAPAPIDTYFGDGAPSDTRAALRDGLAARNELIAAMRSGVPATIEAAATKHLDCMMRLMATEAVLDAEDERKQPIAGRVKFQWGSILDNRARSGTWPRNFAYADVAFTLTTLATSKVNAAHAFIQADDVVSAYKALRAAAGVFTVAESIVKSHAGKIASTGPSQPPELTGKALAGLRDLCIAQAQQCMLLNAEREGKKPSLLAKLSMGLVQTYQATVDHFRSGLGPQMDVRVMETMGSMADTAQALCHKYLSYHHTDESEYGVAVWHARKANQIMSKVLHHSMSTREVIEAARGEAKNIAALAKQTEEDNGTIYFDVIPSDGDITPTKAFVAAKAIPFEMKPAWRDIYAVPERRAAPPPPPSRPAASGGKTEEDVYDGQTPTAPAGKKEMRFACSACTNVIVAAVGTMSLSCPHCKKVNVCIACGKCSTVFSCLRYSDRVKCPECFAINRLQPAAV